MEQIKQNIFKLLKILRDDKTQKDFSIELGWPSQQYHRFESGYKEIKVNDFIKICDFKGFNFKEIIEQEFGFIDAKSFYSDTVNLFASKVQNEKEFLKETGFSKSKWWRLRNEDRELYLVDLFLIIEFSTNRLFRIFERLGFSDFKLDSYEEKNLKDISKFLFHLSVDQLVPFISACLYLKDVVAARTTQEKLEIISKKLEFPIEHLQERIDQMIKDNVLYIKEDGNFEFSSYENNISKYQNEIRHKIFNHLVEKTRHDDYEIGEFNFRVAPVSQTCYKKLLEMQKKYAEEVYKTIISDDSENRDSIYSFFVHSKVD